MAYDRVRRRGAVAEPRRTEEAAPPVTPRFEGMAQLDVLAMQRTMGNAVTAALLSRTPAPARPAPVVGESPLKVQRSFLKKARHKLSQAFGKKKKLKPTAQELLADPTEWEDTKVGAATSTSSSAAKPKKKVVVKAKAPTARGPRGKATDAKSEGEATSEEKGYSGYAPTAADNAYTTTADDLKTGDASESGSESTSDEGKYAEASMPETLPSDYGVGVAGPGAGNSLASDYGTGIAPPTAAGDDEISISEDEKSVVISEDESSEDSSSEESVDSYTVEEKSVDSYTVDDKSPDSYTVDNTPVVVGEDDVEISEDEAEEIPYKVDDKMAALGDDETEISEDEISEDDIVTAIGNRAADMAALLAPPQDELKAAAPYPKTKSRGTEYEKEATEGSPDLEPVFIGPARFRAKAIISGEIPSATDAGGAEWLPFIKREAENLRQLRKPGGKLEKASVGWMLKRLVGMQVKATARWTDADAERFIDERGMLSKEKDFKAVVKYLGPEERLQYELHRDTGAFTQGDSEEPFSTAAMGSNFSGPGYGIFVMDTEGHMYADSHKVGLVHHSSFLAGGDVASAGELKVDNGQLKHVTNKTGHYKAEMPHLAQAVERFQNWGISPDSYEVSLIKPGVHSPDDAERMKASRFYAKYKAGQV